MKTKRILCLFIAAVLALAPAMVSQGQESADAITLEDVFAFLVGDDGSSLYGNQQDMEGTWEYDRAGRPVAVKNLPQQAPAVLLYTFPEITFTWDDQNRLTQMTGTSSMSLDQVNRVLNNNVAEDLVDEAAGLFVEYAESHDCEVTDQGDWLLERLTISMEYDEAGRMITYTEELYDSSLYAYMRTGQDSSTHNMVNILEFNYSDPAVMEITPSMYSVTDGVQGDIQSMGGSVKIPVAYNDEGFPVLFGETDIDIYDQLDFTVNSAEVGYYGYFLNPNPEASVSEMPEVYRAGILGLPLDKPYIATGRVFTLRVEGTTADGQTVIFYVQPDSVGRPMRLRLVDGVCTQWPLAEMNRENTFQIFGSISD